jgi:hypothetical protein
MNNLPDNLRTLLEPVQAKEAGWMKHPPDLEQLSSQLEARGWTLQWQRWLEPLELSLNAGLIERWLGSEAAYRRELSGVLKPRPLKTLEQGLTSLVGHRIPQQLQHHRLIAERRGPEH